MIGLQPIMQDREEQIGLIRNIRRGLIRLHPPGPHRYFTTTEWRHLLYLLHRIQDLHRPRSYRYHRMTSISVTREADTAISSPLVTTRLIIRLVFLTSRIGFLSLSSSTHRQEWNIMSMRPATTLRQPVRPPLRR